MDEAPLIWSIQQLYGKGVEFIYDKTTRTIKVGGESISVDLLFQRAGVLSVGLSWETTNGSYVMGFLPPPKK
jgi:hypothetical protein